MFTKRMELKITLHSDLCCGSGFSHAGVIDQDVDYNEYGFPYIASRRIKGCLREASQMLYGQQYIGELFGQRDNGKTGCLIIENAKLEREEQLCEAIRKTRCQKPLLKQYLRQEAILGMYTSVRAQTKIDEKTGSATEGTLRFTRVVNRQDPLGKQQPLVFIAPIVIKADSQKQQQQRVEMLSNIAKITRNIGLDRNRGLGSVRCELVDAKTKNTRKGCVQRIDERDGSVNLFFAVENISPLVLSEKNKNDTTAFIGGKSVLGLLAGAYIAQETASGVMAPAETSEFADLFLNGVVKYGNMTLQANGQRSFPAPLYLNHLKKTKDFVNLLAPRTEADEKKMLNGNQPKKLKTQFVWADETDNNVNYSVVEAKKELVFHHRHDHAGKGDSEESLAQLYTLECLVPGQRFVGKIQITSPKAAKYAGILTTLLEGTDLRFGKSKSAQYGACRLVECPAQTENNPKKHVNGQDIVVTLKSDALFMEENGNYTVCYPRIRNLLAKELGIADKLPKNEYGAETDSSALETTEVLGYHSMWNLKRAAAAGVRAGSAFVYHLETELCTYPAFVGERTQEGFGEIAINSLDGMKFQADCVTRQEPENCSFELPEELKNFVTASLREEVIEELVYAFEEKIKKMAGSLTASNIGRITLMLKESLQESKDPDKAAADFLKRINTIKTPSVKDKAKSLAEETGAGDDGNPSGKLRKLLGHLEPVFASLDDKSNQRIDELLKGVWGECVLQFLTILKYEKKGG